MSENHPTEQYPIQPQPAPKPALYKRKAVLIPAVVVALAAIGGVTWAATSSSTDGSPTPVAAGSTSVSSEPSNPATSNPATSPANPAPAKPGHGGKHGVVGTIASENGDTWTITTRNGATDTVTITPTTEFGTKKTPQQQSQFAVGDAVVVRGTTSNGTTTATAIAERPKAKEAQTG
ncbi:hypothetical protein [Antrihabitans cavernicola]|uniref:DUF5666 domain-containing protein n=1 Tax=Antrihabitans cavernicola TaxID=2495913 RepID=A0A5A7SG21_9NOCA|nr:hypothetical protein [Spelaeibacter cavernicola]KAA0024766.1 hypothetical protein FOY51_02190 [Spelaeibacter cavernicola]